MNFKMNYITQQSNEININWKNKVQLKNLIKVLNIQIFLLKELRI